MPLSLNACLSEFRLAPVRHMAWMCGATQLNHRLAFELSDWLPAQARETLRYWDQHPAEAPAVVTAKPHARLGLYFERLYECLMVELLGWELLAKNLQIKGAKRTLGELDFVFRNPKTQAVEHHEIAVKFYLGYQSAAMSQPLWYGPNSKDRLDIKAGRLLEHQSQLTRLPETSAALALLDIDQSLSPRIFMPGYLFYPANAKVRAPASVPQAHEHGTWLYVNQVCAFDTRHWVSLCKPHWLGPWVQDVPPGEQSVRASFARIEAEGRPRLFASMKQDDRTRRWVEAGRFFVVPDSWPG